MTTAWCGEARAGAPWEACSRPAPSPSARGGLSPGREGVLRVHGPQRVLGRWCSLGGQPGAPHALPAGGSSLAGWATASAPWTLLLRPRPLAGLEAFAATLGLGTVLTSRPGRGPRPPSQDAGGSMGQGAAGSGPDPPSLSRSSCASGKLSCLGAEEQTSTGTAPPAMAPTCGEAEGAGAGLGWGPGCAAPACPPPADCVAPMVYLNCSNASAGTPGAECLRSCHSLDVDCVSQPT